MAVILTDKNPRGAVRYVDPKVASGLWGLFNDQTPVDMRFWALPAIGEPNKAQILVTSRGAAAPIAGAQPLSSWLNSAATASSYVAIVNAAGTTLETIAVPIGQSGSQVTVLGEIQGGHLFLVAGRDEEALAGPTVTAVSAMLFGYQPVLDGGALQRGGVEPEAPSVLPWILGGVAVVGLVAYMTKKKRRAVPNAGKWDLILAQLEESTAMQATGRKRKVRRRKKRARRAS
jgi:hypothetical protein